MGAVGNASAAVNADKGLPGFIDIDRIYRTGLCTFPAADAELLFHHHTPALPLGICTGRACHYTGRRVAGHAEPSLEPCRKPPRGPDADSRRVPRKALMYKPCTGER